MNTDDTRLVRELTDTFSFQITKYRELKVLVQKMFGKLVLSRGDFSGMIGAMEQKKLLLDSIENERKLHNEAILKWQQRKLTIGISSEVNELDTILENTGNVIKEFIDEEEQLRSYIEHFIKKSEA